MFDVKGRPCHCRDLARGDETGVDFEDIARRRARLISGGETFGRDIFRHINHPPIIIEPNDIEREAHIFHPKTVIIGAAKNEKHPPILIKCRPVRETVGASDIRVGNFDNDIYSPDCQSGRRERRNCRWRYLIDAEKPGEDSEKISEI